jgi:hypothetical protein
MSMCGFPSKDDEGYKQVSREIKVLISEMQRRKEQNVLEKEREITNLRTGSPNQTTTAPATYCM